MRHEIVFCTASSQLFAQVSSSPFALVEMIPESFSVTAPIAAPLWILAAFAGHLLEHTLVAHFHFGEENSLEGIPASRRLTQYVRTGSAYIFRRHRHRQRLRLSSALGVAHLYWNGAGTNFPRDLLSAV